MCAYVKNKFKTGSVDQSMIEKDNEIAKIWNLNKLLFIKKIPQLKQHMQTENIA